MAQDSLAGRRFDGAAFSLLLVAGAAGLMTAGSERAEALVVRGYQSASHDRFVGFAGSGTAANPSFIHAPYDLSGVGWDLSRTERQVTLVSRRHFVGANHWKPAAGAQLRFLGSDGVLRTYTVATRQAILNDESLATDLFLGTLTADVPAGHGVGFHSYLNLGTEAQYVNRPLLVLGKPARGGRGTIAAFSDFGNGSALGGGGINKTRMFTFIYNELVGLPDDAYAEVGDSGSPSFVASGGEAALVGIHSVVAAAGATTTTFDTFVPHYIDELNALMEPQGYHMTPANPGNTTLTVFQEKPNVIRAGYPLTLRIHVGNAGTEDANNLELVHACPAQAQLGSASGASWVPKAAPPGQIVARRGGLAAGWESVCEIELTMPSAGTYANEVTLSADEMASTSSSGTLEVVESFRSWSEGLPSSGAGDDHDDDGVGLLLEYAFGGDPQSAGQFLAGTAVRLLPAVSTAGGAVTVSHLRRRDAPERALTYALEFSHDLTPGSWEEAASVVTTSTSTPINADFDLVEAVLDTTVARCFLRLRVDLAE